MYIVKPCIRQRDERKRDTNHGLRISESYVLALRAKEHRRQYLAEAAEAAEAAFGTSLTPLHFFDPDSESQGLSTGGSTLQMLCLHEWMKPLSAS